VLDWLRLLQNPPVKLRCEVEEVLLQDSVVREAPAPAERPLHDLSTGSPL
jgi:hypothetical protein